MTIEFHVGIVAGWAGLSVRQAKEVTVRPRFWESDQQAVRLGATPVDNRFGCFLLIGDTTVTSPTGEIFCESVPCL